MTNPFPIWFPLALSFSGFVLLDLKQTVLQHQAHRTRKTAKHISFQSSSFAIIPKLKFKPFEQCEKNEYWHVAST